MFKKSFSMMLLLSFTLSLGCAVMQDARDDFVKGVKEGFGPKSQEVPKKSEPASPPKAVTETTTPKSTPPSSSEGTTEAITPKTKETTTKSKSPSPSLKKTTPSTPSPPASEPVFGPK